MDKLKPATDGASANLIEENLAKLRELFPDAFTESSTQGEPRYKVDFDALREVLGDAIEDKPERYSFTWNGKSRAKLIANTPTTATLRPCPEESVNWDTTKNLFIEGDNLEVLKLLQKSYHRKVKMIYIDPPYNTGKEFIYPDKFQDNLDTYLRYSGQVDDDGLKLTANSETAGRYHTNWLNMMLPRLLLARTLLDDDGVLFVSIDDNEVSNLRKVCDEVFGEENFLCQIIWKKRSTPPNDKTIGAQHDYILGYCRNISSVGLTLRERSQEQIDRYKNPDSHPKGPWASSDLTANVKGGRYVASLHFAITNPQTGVDHFPSENGNWRFNQKRIASLLANDEIYFGADGCGKPMLKRFLCDIKEGITWSTLWDFAPLNTQGSKEMRALLGSAGMFENPKPSGLIEYLVKLGCSRDGTVLDFFAGSSSTGHAIMRANLSDRGTRRFIMVQLPEPCPPDSEPAKAGFANIAQIGRQRLRATSEQLATASVSDDNMLRLDEGDSGLDSDMGFRTFTLDSSSVQPWDADFDTIEDTLLDSIDNIKHERTESDVLYELLLKYGLDLAEPIDEREIAGSTVYSVGAGALIVCLAKAIGLDVVEGIVALKKELKPEVMRVVFRDSGFKDDVVKANAVQILKQAGLADEQIRSL